MLISQYLQELKKIQLLSLEEEQCLWLRYKEEGDLESRRRLIEQYQPLVFKIAARWRTDEAVIMDLIQEGTVGLIEAVETYDHSRRVAFSLFASHRIRGRMLNYAEREGKQAWEYMAAPAGDAEDAPDFSMQLVDPRVDIPYQAEQNFLTEEVKKAMDRLPAKEQLVVSGVFLEEREPRQLAEALDISVSHLYRLQKQGIRRMRGMLSKLMHEMKL